MTPSKDCYDLTKKSEGCRLRSYQDTGGVWTIGYGHTRYVGPGQVITQDHAATFLEADMQAAVIVVNNHCLPATQSQFDALTDFVFNVGGAQFLNSHLYRYHVSGEYDKAAAEFPKWKYDNGKVIPGLVTRRALEQALYSRQGPSAVHPHTDVPEHSVVSTVGSVPVGPGPSVVPPSVVPPVPVSGTALVSNTGQSEFLSQAWGLFRNLLGKGPKV